MPNDITCTKLTSGGNWVDDQQVHTTASITPSANKLVLLCIADWWRDSAIDSVSGCGLTWTLVAEYYGADYYGTVYVYRGISASPTTGAITITYNTSFRPAKCCGWSVVQFDNVDVSSGAANAVVQYVNSQQGYGGPASATLAAFSSADNATFGFIQSNRDQGDLVPGTGFTEIDECQVGDYNQYGTEGLETEFRNDNDTSVDCTVPWGWVMFACELKRGTSQSIVPILNSYRQRRN